MTNVTPLPLLCLPFIKLKGKPAPRVIPSFSAASRLVLCDWVCSGWTFGFLRYDSCLLGRTRLNIDTTESSGAPFGIGCTAVGEGFKLGGTVIVVVDSVVNKLLRGLCDISVLFILLDVARLSGYGKSGVFCEVWFGQSKGPWVLSYWKGYSKANLCE